MVAWLPYAHSQVHPHSIVIGILFHMHTYNMRTYILIHYTIQYIYIMSASITPQPYSLFGQYDFYARAKTAIICFSNTILMHAWISQIAMHKWTNIRCEICYLLYVWILLYFRFGANDRLGDNDISAGLWFPLFSTPNIDGANEVSANNRLYTQSNLLRLLSTTAWFILSIAIYSTIDAFLPLNRPINREIDEFIWNERESQSHSFLNDNLRDVSTAILICMNYTYCLYRIDSQQSSFWS